MESIDNSRPSLNYSTAEMLWKIYNIAWVFPKSISPKILKYLLNLVYLSRHVKFQILKWKQGVFARRAKKMGIPISEDTTFVGLQVYRDITKTPFYLGKCVSATLLLDYLRVRGKVTIENMCESGRVFASGEWEGWRAEVFSDHFLHFAVLHQTMAFCLVKSDVSGFDYKIHLSAFDCSDFYSFGVHDFREIHINKDDSEMMIVMRNGDKIRNGDRYWDLAKLYAQSALYYYTLHHSHNWVHFSFPDVVVSKTYSMISSKSNLFKLMEPHIRYVVMTNANGLSGRATARHIGAFSDYIRPDTGALINQPEMAENFVRRSIAFCSGEHSEVAEDLLATPFRLGFPHHGFEGSEIPYIKNLHRLYLITRDFVGVVYENIPDEHREIARWKGEILKLFSWIDREEISPIDFISTFIWQSAFIHSIDHATTSKIYHDGTHIPMHLRMPFDLNSNMSLEGAYHPIDLMAAWGAGNSFLTYVRSSFMDDSMAGLDYRFESQTLVTAQEKFKKDIADELELNWTFSMDGEREVKLRLQDISTSISF